LVVAEQLEDVQVPPGHVLEVVCLARALAHGAREFGAAPGADAQMQVMRLLVRLEALVEQRAGRPSRTVGEACPARL